MKKVMENTERNNGNLNLETLISSAEFKTICMEIANGFGVDYRTNLYQDVKQVCAIAVFESLERYDTNKCSGINDGTTNYRFWHYAYGRMWQYSKREVNEQRNLVHIPENRLGGSKRYEKVEYSYEGLTYDDGHNKPFDTETNSVDLSIDIKSAMEMLDAETRYIIEVRSEIVEGKSGKSDWSSIAKDLNMSVSVVRNLYKSGKEQLAEMLK